VLNEENGVNDDGGEQFRFPVEKVFESELRILIHRAI
jgi:hypothetical protein